jgi:thiamine biosynthesis lipoprotein
MGTDAHVVVVGPSCDGLAHWAEARIAELEARWSRFLPASELSHLNRHAGELVLLSDDTYTIVELAIAAWHTTAGHFDPTVHDALCSLGYDRTFDEVAAGAPAHDGSMHAASGAPGCAGIELIPEVGGARLPPGVHLDLGGIGKGHAADVVCEALLTRGAAGACVGLGGDVRVVGQPPDGQDAWTVDVLHPINGLAVARASLSDGAIATSTRTRRRWTRGGSCVHHLLDPRTGMSTTGVAGATVVAGTATLAEVLTKVLFADGPGESERALVERHHATGFTVADDGSVTPLAGLDAYVRWL